jgi:hypothetical protein
MPDNDDERQELTYDEAVALLPDGDDIHTILNPGSIMLGADWSREAILNLLRESPRREVTGPMAQAMGHGLAALDVDGRTLFIETKVHNEH